MRGAISGRGDHGFQPSAGSAAKAIATKNNQRAHVIFRILSYSDITFPPEVKQAGYLRPVAQTYQTNPNLPVNES